MLALITAVTVLCHFAYVTAMYVQYLTSDNNNLGHADNDTSAYSACTSDPRCVVRACVRLAGIAGAQLAVRSQVQWCALLLSYSSSSRDVTYVYAGADGTV